MTKEPVEKAVTATVRCEDCGAQSRNVIWRPGDTCPKCRSENYCPLVVKGGKPDYETADRSQAFALEDIRFGRLTQWAELATPNQVQRALHEQKALAGAGQKVPDIAALFLRDKLLTKEQAQALHAARRARPNSKDDQEFAKAVLRLGYVSQEQLDECRRIQKEADSAGHDALPLPMLVLEKRLMQENQVLALLKNAERQGTGLLHRAKTIPREERTPPMEVLLGPKGAPLYWVRAFIIILLPIVILAMGYRVATGAGVRCTTQCAKCMAVTGAPDNSKWPIKCPGCGSLTMWPQAICLDCGSRFAVTGIGYGIDCPRCHSSRFKHVTNKVDVKKLEAEIKAQKSVRPKE